MGDIMQKDTDFHNVLNHSVSDNALNHQCKQFYDSINQCVDNNVVSNAKAGDLNSVCVKRESVRDSNIICGSCTEGVNSGDLECTLPPYIIAGDCDLGECF
jgi:hypothetical protein